MVQIVFAVFTVLAGLVAALAGGYGLHQARRIRRAGHGAMALVKPPPPGAERALLEYETRDGRVMEVPAPAPLRPEGSVRLWYDPADPRDVVVDGHERAWLDWGFVAVGLTLTAIGAALALLAGASDG